MSAITQLSARLHAWPHGFSQDLPSDHWMVLHALPRQEKVLANALAQRGIPGCLFLENRTRKYSKSVQKFDVPLIGGYIFAHLPRERRDEAFGTGRVSRIIDVTDPLRLRNEIDALRLMIDATPDVPLVVKPELVPGIEIEIIDGTFSGCRGIITRRKDATQLVVNLKILGCSVATTIPADIAERYAPTPP